MAAACAIASSRAAKGISSNRTLNRLPARPTGVSKVLTDLERGGVGPALVVDPVHLQIVTLGAAFEREFHVRVLGDRRSPIGNEHLSASVFEGQFPDVVSRDEFAPVVLDETRIHRML